MAKICSKDDPVCAQEMYRDLVDKFAHHADVLAMLEGSNMALYYSVSKPVSKPVRGRIRVVMWCSKVALCSNLV